MFNIAYKICREVVTQSKNRGLKIAFIMNLSHLKGITRGLFYKIIYPKNIKSTIYSMQQNSKIEIFNKNSSLNIGKYVFIRKNASVRLDFNAELVIEEKVFINDNCIINCVNKITIGSKTKIGPNVCINDHDHNFKNESDQHLIKGEVHIGKNVWIGANAVILKDTWIGDHSVIAAGSVVKGLVPENTLFMNDRTNKLKNIKQKTIAT
ncbi:acyltransferase [Metabacillus indicus]|uniref:Galacturonic acid acetylase n=1 Tax=Metabacillus indicus TaxID=246786 RepID=A0A084H4H5_METID|nr:acyltransferase [Metabacillus indicus]KEZ50331.1 galacturonic acid acetylase [Metabacillus indicus LMG 22858]KEZ54487.1 galacturonic acid acetylase [Metabacillus indicus]